MSRLAIIGGTGVYDPQVFDSVTDKTIDTPYGKADYTSGQYKGREIIFMARHGKGHTVAPHKINYRANIWALYRLGVKFIISTTAVGSLKEDMKPGDFVITDQFLDFTKSRVNTFFEEGTVVHADMTTPYDSYLREVIFKAGTSLGYDMHDGGTYVCTEGPRFETPAEIAMYAALGAHTVGMTNVPEVVLANEAEIAYATISMVTNYGSGISEHPLTHHEVTDIMKDLSSHLQALLLKIIDAVDVNRDVPAHHRLAEYGGFHQLMNKSSIDY